MRLIRVITLLVFAGDPLTAAPGPMELFSTTAATYSTQTSNDAYPIGNGKLAAMIYGGVSQEILQFNEDTVWAGQPHDYSHTGAVNSLATIRNYVWAGQGTNAYSASNGPGPNFMSIPLRQSPYQPTANLRLNFSHASPTNYRRSLDLETATAKVQYTNGGVNYTREYFASYPDQVIVSRITASQAGALSFNYTFDSQHTASTVSTSGTDLIIDGKVNKDANTSRQQVSDVWYRAKVKITAEGGTVTAGSTNITVSGATAVTLVMSVASNFVKYNDLTGDRVARTDAVLSAAGPKNHAQLRTAHLADYQPLFQRVLLDLNSTNKSSLETSARLDAVLNDAALAADLQFVALNFQMARYLYIAGSRPGSQPLTLQGKWNNEMDPAWESKMTLNINQEMNYWGVEVMNLSECHLPMVALTRDLAETGAIVAQQHYGASGWMVHHNTDLWRGAAPINNAGGLWPTGGAWLSMHLWWHYLYTGDETYLAEIYPLMKGAAQFFVDFLVVDPRSGRQPYLLTNPSHSPEQPNPALGDDGELVAGTTMDCQLIRELFTYVIKSGEILGIDSEFRALVTAKRTQLPPNKIGRLGQLQEWLEDVDVANQHRHLSPLLGMFPADQISPVYDPALAAACKIHLDWKGDPTNNTSWSQAWKLCLRNTLFDGNRGFTILQNILRTSHSNNLTFSIKGGGSPENQIDGNFGAAMGISQFFLQNNRGEIHLLPALPNSIPHGKVTGLRSPAAFTVGINWAGGILERATIHSDRGNPCRIRIASAVHVMKGGALIPLTTMGANLYEFATEPVADYEILPGAVSSTDTDLDGLVDAFETGTGVFVSSTSTGSSLATDDTDQDGLKDGHEVLTLGTNPNRSDTDNDGLADKVEVALISAGLNPLQNSAAWMTLLTQNGPPLGLFTRDQLLRSVVGSQVFQRSGASDDFSITVNVLNSGDLGHWDPVDLANDATVTRDAGTFHFGLSSSGEHAFFRFTLREILIAPGPPLPAVDLTDSDDDGIPDVTESALASMGFNPTADSSSLQQLLQSNAAGLGLHRSAAIRGIDFGGPKNFVKGAENAVSFDLAVKLQDALGAWSAPAFQPANVMISGQELRLTLPTDPAVEFFQLTPSP
ncbi:MAG: glycoside hydrolase N-terminal domain-containing protein [Verrucomicrobiota bacterium]